MLHFQGQLVRVNPSVPLCCSLLREFTATSGPFPGSLRSARLQREKEPPLETIPSIKPSWWSSAAEPGRDGLQKVFVSTSQSDDWGLLFTQLSSMCFYFLKKKCKNWEKPSSPGTSTPLVEILLIYIYYILIFTISVYIYNTKEWNNKCILLCFHSNKVMNRFQWNCQEMLIMGQRTRGYILVILEGLWSFKDHQPTSKSSPT